MDILRWFRPDPRAAVLRAVAGVPASPEARVVVTINTPRAAEIRALLQSPGWVTGLRTHLPRHGGLRFIVDDGPELDVTAELEDPRPPITALRLSPGRHGACTWPLPPRAELRIGRGPGLSGLPNDVALPASAPFVPRTLGVLRRVPEGLALLLRPDHVGLARVVRPDLSRPDADPLTGLLLTADDRLELGPVGAEPLLLLPVTDVSA